MKARLFCPIGDLEGLDVLIEREAIIGRAPGNEIVLSSAVVSGKHARIYFEGQESFWIEDLGSRNGTRIDGRPLLQPRRLGDLHVVTLADGLDFVFQVVPDDFVRGEEGLETPRAVDATADGMQAPQLPEGLSSEAEREPSLQPRSERELTVFKAAPIVAPDFDAPDQPPSQAPSSEATSRGEAPPIAPAGLSRTPDNIGKAPDTKPSVPSAPEPASPSLPRFFLMAENEDGTATSYPLSSGENLVGRLDECPVQIQHPTVSRRHALLTVKEGKVFLRELAGLNPVLLAGDKVEGEVEVQLNQEVQIGQVKMVLVKR